ncbi:MAG: hypothetical protein ACI9LM_003809, partial [Alteromonadaceae bacterium]
SLQPDISRMVNINANLIGAATCARMLTKVK